MGLTEAYSLPLIRVPETKSLSPPLPRLVMELTFAARATDITVCPDQYTWGLSYDDGPSPYTPLLLDYLDEVNITSTFFLVGSRVLSRPEMVQTEYMKGHQLSVHTWSHPYLTKLTNEEIVAELGWTKQVIKDVVGVTPNTFRPPYGDIDDRVRAIAAQMGLTPVIWSSVTANGTTTNFDTVSLLYVSIRKELTREDRLEYPGRPRHR
jgi:peptidoglycan/xylan/chitin deacetylase (PgdA/CDA1 family)